MSYQYPPPPSLRLRSDLEPSQMAADFQLPSVIYRDRDQLQAPDDRLPQDFNSNPKSGSKVGEIIRSTSTPNFRGQAAADAALAASADKRRNKLGYHRTSVACGHCRRRKIRCIPAPGDLQSRCANCIRLKKECNFYPVDQGPPSELKSQRGTNGSTETGRISSSFSPLNQSGHSSEVQDKLPHSTLSMSPFPGLPGVKRSRTDNFALENKAPVFRAPQDYPPPPAFWMNSELASATRTQSDGSSYWSMNAQESLLTPTFSALLPNLHLPQRQSWQPAAAETSPREDVNWLASQRSTSSFGNLEDPPHQPSYSHFPPSSMQTKGHEQVAARPRPQQIDPYVRDQPSRDSISASTTPPGSTMGQLAQVSGPIQPPPCSVGQGWQAQPQPQYNYTKPLLPQVGEGLAPWYDSGSSTSATPQIGGDSIQQAPYSHPGAYGAIYYNDVP